MRSHDYLPLAVDPPIELAGHADLEAAGRTEPLLGGAGAPAPRRSARAAAGWTLVIAAYIVFLIATAADVRALDYVALALALLGALWLCLSGRVAL